MHRADGAALAGNRLTIFPGVVSEATDCAYLGKGVPLAVAWIISHVLFADGLIHEPWTMNAIKAVNRFIGQMLVGAFFLCCSRPSMRILFFFSSRRRHT